MNRLFFVNRFYRPDHSATSQLLSDLAEAAAAAGSHVHVIASRMLSDDTTVVVKAYEVMGGVHVHRVATTRFGRGTMLGRTADYLSFYLTAFVHLVHLIRRGDTVVAKTDPPMLSVVCWLAVALRGATLVNWLQDLFPELASKLDIGLAKGAAGRMLRWIRDRSLRAADLNVVIGDLMRATLIARGVSIERIAVIPNWADDGAIFPVSHEHNRLRKEWGLDNKFVVGYSGNLGRAHDYQTLLRTAELLRHEHHIIFLIIGGGKQRAEFKAKARSLALNIHLQGLPAGRGAPLEPERRRHPCR